MERSTVSSRQRLGDRWGTARLGRVVLSNQVYVDRTKLPPALVNRIIRLAAFQNPEFCAAQTMRLPTFGESRVISCAELLSKHIALPRGYIDDLLGLLRDVGIAPDVRDELIEARFLGELTPEQERAAKALLPHQAGVLAVTTAFSKAVVAAKIIGERGRNTLVIFIGGSFSINGWCGSEHSWTYRRRSSG